MLGDRLEKIATTTLTVAAAIISVVVIRREFFPPAPAAAVAGRAEPRFIADWKSIATSGQRRGPANAAVTIVEFSDFECPFCKRFHENALNPVMKEMEGSVAHVFVHFPLNGHRFARPAAHAAECAADQGRFIGMSDQLFAKQDSLGLKSWESFATDAGVDDRKRFQACLTSPQAPVIDTGVATGMRIGILGTPTVLVNGWLTPMPPTDSALRAAITNALRR